MNENLPLPTITNPESVVPGHRAVLTGAGTVDYVCHAGQWEILTVRCTGGYVPPQNPNLPPCTTNGTVRTAACVPGTDSAFAASQSSSAKSA
ncbi:MAG TPA: hypothetical protein DCY13_18390 [Verrucomicrobiales bacterium]|nr:hypothetical protein [Verrucomicrobiales bacterium]